MGNLSGREISSGWEERAPGKSVWIDARPDTRVLASMAGRLSVEHQLSLRSLPL